MPYRMIRDKHPQEESTSVLNSHTKTENTTTIARFDLRCAFTTHHRATHNDNIWHTNIGAAIRSSARYVSADSAKPDPHIPQTKNGYSPPISVSLSHASQTLRRLRRRQPPAACTAHFSRDWRRRPKLNARRGGRSPIQPRIYLTYSN